MTPDDNYLLIDSGASVSVVNGTLPLNKKQSFSREILTSINGATPVTRSGFATVGLIDTEGEYFKFSFEAKCAPGVELPGVGILSCSGYSINLIDSSGVIRLPDDLTAQVIWIQRVTRFTSIVRVDEREYPWRSVRRAHVGSER